jgi:hypothetical protein
VCVLTYRFANAASFKKALAARELQPVAVHTATDGDAADTNASNSTLTGFAAALQRHR